MLLSIIIFTNSTAIEPGSSAIIIMLSLFLIILIISINYKQERGTAGRSREAGIPRGGRGGLRLASLPALPLPPSSCFWPRPSVLSTAWPKDTGGSRWPFRARVPGRSRPPHTEPHSASQKLLRHNYYRDSHSKLIFQLLHSCNHGDGPSSITCLLLFLKDSGRQSRRRRPGAAATDRGSRRERQRAMDTETLSKRDRALETERNDKPERAGAGGTEREGTARTPGKMEQIYTERRRQRQPRETARIKHGKKTGGGTEAKAATRTWNHTHTHILLERASPKDSNTQMERRREKIKSNKSPEVRQMNSIFFS